MIDNTALNFAVESTIEEIKEVLLNHIEETSGKLTKNDQNEIIATYGSQI